MSPATDLQGRRHVLHGAAGTRLSTVLCKNWRASRGFPVFSANSEASRASRLFIRDDSFARMSERNLSKFLKLLRSNQGDMRETERTALDNDNAASKEPCSKISTDTTARVISKVRRPRRQTGFIQKILSASPTSWMYSQCGATRKEAASQRGWDSVAQRFSVGHLPPTATTFKFV